MGENYFSGLVWRVLAEGFEIPGHFLELADFKLLEQGNGSGYVLYGKGDKYFLFKKGKRDFLLSDIKHYNEDPIIKSYIEGHKLPKF